MLPNNKHFSAKIIGELTGNALSPLLKKRSGLNIDLFRNWPNITDAITAQNTQPLKIIWPKASKAHKDFYSSHNTHNTHNSSSACLLVACDSSYLLEFSYQIPVLIKRINRFFGYTVISNIRVEQQSLNHKIKISVKEMEISEETLSTIENIVKVIENENLKKTLRDLGKSIYKNKYK